MLQSGTSQSSLFFSESCKESADGEGRGTNQQPNYDNLPPADLRTPASAYRCNLTLYFCSFFWINYWYSDFISPPIVEVELDICKHMAIIKTNNSPNDGL